MKANYKKLWHILLDKNMKKKELAELAGVSIIMVCEKPSFYKVKKVFCL